MNHLVSTLPNPDNEFLQKFDKVSFKNKSVLLNRLICICDTTFGSTFVYAQLKLVRPYV